jgi:hypothetical protein
MAPRRLIRRFGVALGAIGVLVIPAAPAIACGGLVAPNGTVSLLRTTTLAAYHEGVEHYVTSFEFAGQDATEVGSIVPLPGIPSDVIKGGDWTLQRLVLETQPQPETLAVAGAAFAARDGVQVLLQKQIDALEITVLKGGAVGVGDWAREHGFFLPPDAPEVLDFYARRSPIFLAARFDASEASERGIGRGDGTPIHIVIPTPDPWVPLRILALGRQPQELVQADVYLLTDLEPATLPQATEGGDEGLIQELSRPASAQLMTDLGSDRGMGWVPDEPMWLTYLRVNAQAQDLTYDLAIDASGFGRPDPVAAGLEPTTASPGTVARPAVWAIVLTVGLVVAAVAAGRRRAGGRPAI